MVRSLFNVVGGDPAWMAEAGHWLTACVDGAAVRGVEAAPQ
jgi:hypothetical protein